MSDYDKIVREIEKFNWEETHARVTKKKEKHKCYYARKKNGTTPLKELSKIGNTKAIDF